MTSRTWITMGVLAVGYASFVTACAPLNATDGTPRVEMAASEDDARLTEALRLWAQENDEMGDAFTAGKAAYDIASVTHDPKWARAASRKLGEAREVLPGFAQATAWQGSAQSLIARDYPLQGAWQALPGPGFVRIYHVKRAEALLNAAVDEAPNDPVVRLLRAATMIQMPGVLTDHAVAQADFALLAAWEADPAQNPDYAMILTSDDWRRAFHDAYARAQHPANAPHTAQDQRLRAVPFTKS